MAAGYELVELRLQAKGQWGRGRKSVLALAELASGGCPGNIWWKHVVAVFVVVAAGTQPPAVPGRISHKDRHLDRPRIGAVRNLPTPLFRRSGRFSERDRHEWRNALAPEIELIPDPPGECEVIHRNGSSILHIGIALHYWLYA